MYVEDIGEVYCKDQTIKKKVEKVRVYNKQKEETYDYITAKDIISKVLDSIDNIDVTIIGGPDVLLEIKDKESSNNILEILKILVICAILFFGSGLAIVNFYEDVEMKASIEKIHYIITGEDVENPMISTIPLSIGVGLGILTFFNRVISLSKRRRQEPGPLEIELNLYDKDMEEVIIKELKNKDNT